MFSLRMCSSPFRGTAPCLFSTTKTRFPQNGSVIVSAKEGRPENPSQEDPFLQAGLLRDLNPRHVAVVLDGSRRWAKAHAKDLDYEPIFQGYLDLADLCIKWGIAALSCIIFSSDNWKRSKEANDLLLGQFQKCLEEGLENFTRKKLKVTVTGEKSRLSKSLQEVIQQVEKETQNNSKLELNFGVSYGRKWDIIEATKSIAQKVRVGEMELDDINEDMVANHLSTRSLQFPDPDLMIRTGGVQRVSNLWIWQMSHTELYFTPAYGPDFQESHFIDALRWYQQCDRRFGK